MLKLEMLATAEHKTAPILILCTLENLNNVQKKYSLEQDEVDSLRRAFQSGTESQFWLHLTRGSFLFIHCVKDVEKWTSERIRKLYGNLYHRAHDQGIEVITLDIDSLLDLPKFPKSISPKQAMRSATEGFCLPIDDSHFRMKTIERTQEKRPPLHVVRILKPKLASRAKEAEKTADYIQHLADAVYTIRHWSNAPSNVGTPEFYANDIKRIGKRLGLSVRILDRTQAAKENMNLFLGVSQGSDREPRMCVVEYKPKAKSKKKIALVGKGVTFDSGGISIKPGTGMAGMIHDMTGAATVMGIMMLAASQELPVHLVGVMAFCENMPGGDAIQPGNVIKSRNGKTVEIINTDAEGRLILADALDFAQDYEPDQIIDFATLTGAMLVTLGHYCAGVFGNDDKLMAKLIAASKTADEQTWHLPMYPEQRRFIDTPFADMRNLMETREAGSIQGAVFLKEFIKKNRPWAHFDIAGVADGVTHLSYIPKKGATGLTVRTIFDYLSNI